jgi:hypothetical protein
MSYNTSVPTTGGAAPAPPRQVLPDDLFIFVMCCCALAITAVSLVFVYYCHRHHKLCFRSDGRRRPLATNERSASPAASDGYSQSHAIAMEETLLHAQPTTSTFGTAVGRNRPEAHADARAADARSDDSSDRDDKLAPAAAYYQTGDRYEFLVLPEKEASDPGVAGETSGRGSPVEPDAAAPEFHGMSALQRKWMTEWLGAVADAITTATVTGMPLDDPVAVPSPIGSPLLTANSSERSDSDSARPMAPRRLLPQHRISRNSGSSTSTQPSAVTSGHFRAMTLSTSPQQSNAAAAAASTEAILRGLVPPSHPPTRRNTGPVANVKLPVVSLAQLLEDPFGRGTAPIVLPVALQEFTPFTNATLLPGAAAHVDEYHGHPTQSSPAEQAGGRKVVLTPRRILDESSSTTSTQ